MNKTGISYLDYTWNPTHGCSHSGTPGCDHCWARDMAKYLAGMGVKGYSKDEPFRVVFDSSKLSEPHKVKKPSIIGVSFMGDLFHDNIHWASVGNILQVIAHNTHHKFLLLTKRPEKMAHIIHVYNDIFGLPKNLWLGVSCENQETANERIPILLSIPNVKRFVSFEPLLGKINYDLSELDWALIGAESGSGMRQCDIGWVRNLASQCWDADIPVFIKQIHQDGKLIKDINQFPEDLRIQEFPEGMK